MSASALRHRPFRQRGGGGQTPPVQDKAPHNPLLLRAGQHKSKICVGSNAVVVLVLRPGPGLCVHEWIIGTGWGDALSSQRNSAGVKIDTITAVCSFRMIERKAKASKLCRCAWFL